MKPEDLAQVETDETKALLNSVGNDRQKLLLQWIFYVNGSDQMKKDMTSMRGEEGWVYMMTFVYHFQFTADEIRKALSLFPDSINPERDYSGPRTPGGRMTITRDDYVLGEDIAHS